MNPRPSSTTRPRNSAKASRICFEAHRYVDELTGRTMLQCHWGKHPIDPARDKWRADHIRRFATDGEDTPENLWPICEKCDVTEKAPIDNREVKKGRRVHDKHFGIVRKQGFWKPPNAKWDWKQKRWVRLVEAEEVE